MLLVFLVNLAMSSNVTWTILGEDLILLCGENCRIVAFLYDLWIFYFMFV